MFIFEHWIIRVKSKKKEKKEPTCCLHPYSGGRLYGVIVAG